MRATAAVIGSPIAHSLSPEIFAFLSRRAPGVDLNYTAVRVESSELRKRLFEFAADPFFVGTNVTIPHKEAVLKMAEVVTPIAKSTGAANVLHRSGDQWTAHNTDIYGVSEALRENGLQLFESSVLILGAGGAARAAAVAAANENAKSVHLLNRTHSRAETIVSDLAHVFPKTDFLSLRDLNDLRHETQANSYDAVIQTTSLGMTGISGDAEAEFIPIMNEIKNQPFGFDLIYRPEKTVFLKECEVRGWPSMGGLGMLAHQAIATWKIWFPKLDLPTSIAKDLIQHLRQHLDRQHEIQTTIQAGVKS